MAIEVLDDILSDITDKIGYYTPCDDPIHPDRCSGECRACFESELKTRILSAVQVEYVMTKHGILIK